MKEDGKGQPTPKRWKRLRVGSLRDVPFHEGRSDALGPRLDKRLGLQCRCTRDMKCVDIHLLKAQSETTTSSSTTTTSKPKTSVTREAAFFQLYDEEDAVEYTACQSGRAAGAAGAHSYARDNCFLHDAKVLALQGRGHSPRTHGTRGKTEPCLQREPTERAIIVIVIENRNTES